MSHNSKKMNDVDFIEYLKEEIKNLKFQIEQHFGKRSQDFLTLVSGVEKKDEII